jgi:hypothetical protein
MKTAIYQYWDGPVRESVHACVKNIKAYADKIGADYLFEDNPKFITTEMKMNLANYTPHYGSFKVIFNSNWDKYDKILFLDTDVFAVDNLKENIFDFFTKEIGICTEPFQPKQRQITLGQITSKQDEKFADFVKKKYNTDLPRTSEGLVKVYNTGMVLYSKEGRLKAQKEFDNFEKFVRDIKNHGLIPFYGSDQGYLHAMMFAKGFDVQEMDNNWNSYIHGTKDKHQPKRRIVDHRTPETKFVHCQFPGADNMNEEQLLKIVNLPREQWGYDI